VRSSSLADAMELVSVMILAGKLGSVLGRVY
jgi:hypothetical protein